MVRLSRSKRIKTAPNQRK